MGAYWGKRSCVSSIDHVPGIPVTGIQSEMCPGVPMVWKLCKVPTSDIEGPHYLSCNANIGLQSQGRAQVAINGPLDWIQSASCLSTVHGLRRVLHLWMVERVSKNLNFLISKWYIQISISIKLLGSQLFPFVLSLATLEPQWQSCNHNKVHPGLKYLL